MNLRYDLGQGEDENWCVSEVAFDPQALGKCEAIFTQGNGYLGQRAALEEGYVGETRNLFVAGTFNCVGKGDVTELPNLPDLTNMAIFINGQRFSMAQGELKKYERRLNLRTGELTREVLWRAPDEMNVSFRFSRFVSLTNEHALGARVEITADQEAVIEIQSGIDARVTNSGAQHFLEGDKRLFDNRILQMCVTTAQSKVHCCLHTAHAFFMDGKAYEPKILPLIDRRKLGIRASLQLAPEQVLTVEKMSCVHTSRDQGFGGTKEELKAKALEEARRLLCVPYHVFLSEGQTAYKRFWKSQDIRIVSQNAFDQLAMRFALYHLNIMVKKDDPRVSIAAKGLSGEGYKGHAFWDTETFIFPYFLFTQPDVAKTLLTYRYRTLPGARRKASENGYEGAMFPWESAWEDDGEATPLLGAADVVTGEPMPILTGILEQHISADIALAVWQYFTATGDQGFMDECGYEIIIDTARFWASRATWDEKRQAYVILDVIGPDEYKEHVDNNAYTNYLAKENMRLALSMMETLAKNGGEAYGRLDAMLDFAASEKAIKKVMESLYLPQPDAHTGIVPQADGYLELPQIDLTRYKEADEVGTIYHDYNIEQISGMQVAKQADLLVLLVLFETLFDDETRRKNYDYYEARTLHDSSLSKSTHCVLACDLGQVEHAYRFFEGSCRIDLGQQMNSSDMGIHAASMAGIWQCVAYGFAGVRADGAGLNIHPKLPEEWQSLHLKIVWQNQPLSLAITKESISVGNGGEKTCLLTIWGTSYALQPGSEVRVDAK